MYTLQLLGDVSFTSEIAAADQRTLGGPRGVTVLARLALARGASVHRSELASALWGTSLPDTWAASLRNVLADLRRGLATVGLADSTLRTLRSGYVLEPDAPLEIDVEDVLASPGEAERLLAIDEPVQALASVKAVEPSLGLDFLPGMRTPWVESIRVQLDQAHLRCALAGAQASLAGDDPASAERCARRALDVAPLREDGHRLLMQALAASGNRAAALAAYERCRRLLADQLGVSPSVETQAAFALLLQQDGETSAVRLSRQDPSVSGLLLARGTTTLLGRESELAELETIAAGVHRCGPTLAIVRGELGVGKTRLAAELTVSLLARGVQVLYGRSEDRLDIPFRPILEAVDSALRGMVREDRQTVLGRHGPSLAALLPTARELFDPAPVLGVPDLDQRRLFEAIRHVLHVLARAQRERGLVLILDDMHVEGPSMIKLLDFVLDSDRPVPLLVVELRRRRTPAERPELERGAPPGSLTVLDLQPLTRGAIGALVRSYCGEGDDPVAVTETVWRQSGGNPLYATQLLRLAGPRRLVDAGDDLVQSDLPVLGERMRRLVWERVQLLPAEARELLRLAAVAGLEFDPDVIARAAGRDRQQVASLVEQSVGDGLIVLAGERGEKLAFRHALVRSSLLADLSSGRLAALHAQLAAALERAAGAVPVAPARLAHHLVGAGAYVDRVRAATYALRLARVALDAVVPEDAAEAAQRGLDALAEVADPPDRLQVELLIALATARLALDDESAQPVLAEAFAAAVDLGDHELVGEAALAHGQDGAAADEPFRHDRARPVYEQALAALGDDHPVLRARLLARLATAHGWAGDAGRGGWFGDQAIELARQVADLPTLATVLTARRRALAGSGLPAAARALEDELAAIAASLHDEVLACRTHLWRAETAIELGAADELDAALEHAALAPGRHLIPRDRHTLYYLEAARDLMRGDVPGADTAVEMAAEYGRAVGVAAPIVEGIRLIQLMGVRHEQHLLAQIRDELAEFFARVGVPEWNGATAFVDAELGRLDGVPAQLELVFAGYAAGGARTAVGIGFAAHLATPVARLGDRGKAGVLHDMLAPFAGTGALAGYLMCPVDYALGATAAVLGDSVSARTHFRDGAAFAERSRAPRWQARCLAAAELGHIPDPGFRP